MISIYPGPERDYTVLVRCFTFNQSKYIEDALNGFVMQQTTFPFVCLVVDDASTDGEPEVIKSWMERECDMAEAKHIDIPTANIIIVPHKTNLNCTMAVYLLKENLFRQKEKKMEHVTPWREHCRYEALCEGDDYWIAPQKLQKQVDLLEAHPDCCLTYHACKNEFDGIDEGYHFGESVKPMYGSVELLYYPFQTATVMLRCGVLKSELYRKARLTKCVSGDVMLFLTASCQGHLLGVNEQMSVYRRQQGSISRTFENLNVVDHYISWYKASKLFGREVENLIIREYLYKIALSCIKKKKYKSFVEIAFYAFVTCPVVLLLVLKYCVSKIVN